MPGRVEALYIAEDKGQPMHWVSEAQAIAGKGLRGDRYAEGKGAFSMTRVGQVVRHVSLISREAIQAANDVLADDGVKKNTFHESQTRRNIITSGIELNDLVDTEFYIGDIALRGDELCTPCVRPDKLAGKNGFATAFANNGGLRAEILTSGIIVVGASIVAQEVV